MMDLDELFFKYGVYLPVTAVRGQRVRSYLQQLEASERTSVEDRRVRQLQRLQALVTVARQAVPHYRDTLPNNVSLESIDDLQKLPCVDKAALKAAPDRFRSNPLPSRVVAKTTGGSTGQPLTILKSADAMAHELAATWRGYGWAGIGIGTRQARFWGVPFDRKDRLKARVSDFVCNRFRCSAFAFDQQDLVKYEQQLVRFRPSYFYGYVSMLVAFANHYRSLGTRPPFNLRCIITTSEILTPGDRALLSEVFRTRVFDEYGCGELGTIAHECDAGRLHVSDENMIVEVLDQDRRCAPGEKGELVVTELNNLAMPLIRYRTGDFGALAGAPCACGRTLNVLETVYGRAYDFIVAADGRRFHGEFLMYVFEEAQRRQMGIAQFQVQQREVTDFLVRIIPGPGYGRHSTDLVLARMRQHLGTDISVTFETVRNIARESSGKMRVIVGMPVAPAAEGTA
jgi:phenylacetate-CoA ligase